MEFQDKMLKCIDCGADFVFTAGEQLFFHDKQFKNEPKRCKTCKTKRVSVLAAPPPRAATGTARRVETRATCSQCGKETTVPFRPTQGRPVFCRECFTQNARPPPPPDLAAQLTCSAVHESLRRLRRRLAPRRVRYDSIRAHLPRRKFRLPRHPGRWRRHRAPVRDRGLDPAASAAQAALVVLNTCTVTASADQDARAAIRRIHRQNPIAKIVVTGCYAQRAPEEVAALPGVTAVIGNSHKHRLAEIAVARLGRSFPCCARNPARSPLAN